MSHCLGTLCYVVVILRDSFPTVLFLPWCTCVNFPEVQRRLFIIVMQLLALLKVIATQSVFTCKQVSCSSLFNTSATQLQFQEFCRKIAGTNQSEARILVLWSLQLMSRVVFWKISDLFTCLFSYLSWQQHNNVCGIRSRLVWAAQNSYTYAKWTNESSLFRLYDN